MRTIRPISVVVLMVVFSGCHKTEETPAAPKPEEATVVDREFEMPPARKVADLYTVTEYGGQLIGEVAVTKGAAVNVRVAVDNKTVFQDDGVRRTAIDVTLPPGNLLIEIGRHGDDTDPLSISEKFKMRREH